MKKLSLLAIVLTLTIFANAQVSGTKNIPGDYATLALAIADLNTNGVGAGGVTINLNQIETAPSGGYLLGSAVLNASTGASKPIVINGNNNNITSQSGSSSTTSDAVLRVAGPDYVTLNQLKIVENAANTTIATQMERGIAIMAWSATDGSQNIIIQNCSITLAGNTTGNANQTGIVLTNILYNNTSSAYTTAVVPTNSFGKFENIQVKGNTVANCYTGIAAHGGTVLATADTLQHLNVVIGGTNSADGNTITGFGSAISTVTTLANGLYVSSVRHIYISNNSATTALNTFNANNGINLTSAAGNTVCSKNTISLSTILANTSAQNGISYSSFTANLTNTARCDSNTVQNVTLAGTGAFVGVNQSIIGLTGASYYCRNNTVNNITKTSVSGNVTGILYSSTSALFTPSDRQMLNNKVSNITASSLTSSIVFNGLQWVGANGLMKGNVVDTINLTNTNVASTTVNLINSVSSLTNTTTPAAHRIDSNTVKNVTLTGPSFSVFGAIITDTSKTTGNSITRNLINNISIVGGGTIGLLEGISFPTNTAAASTVLNISNNIISDLKASAVSADNAIKGINIAVGNATNNQINNNTIHLGSASTLTTTGTNFGVSGIVFTVGVTLKNNIVNVKATQKGTGTVAAIRSLLAGSSGTVSANFGANSSNNILYAPNAANSFLYSESANGIAPVVFYNLANDPGFNSPCSIFKTQAGVRGAGTYTEDNLTAITTGIFAPTGSSNAESNSTVLANVITDYYGVSRPSTPDCGAVEFSGTTSDLSGPTISFVNQTDVTYCTTMPTFSATITDISGINTTTAKPRLYYKKSTSNDAFVGNTSADNGWKYVEATNTSSPFTFTFDASLLMTPPVVGDNIQYFVVAQDLATIPNVGTFSATYKSGYCPSTVNILAAGFPLQTTTVVNSFNIVSPNITLSATATPAIICINGSSSLTAVDTLTIPGNFPSGYTGPFVTGVDDHEIRRFQIVGTTLNNSSTCTTTGGSAANGLPASIQNRYSNYTSTVPAITLTNGSTYTANLDGTVCGTGSGFTMGISVFIDLNRNGVFDMPIERVYGNPSLDAVVVNPAVSTKSFTFTIPSSGVVNGPTLMRVYLNGYVSGINHTPSTTTAFGEVEDYQIYLNTNMSPVLNTLSSSSFNWAPTTSLATNPNKNVVVSNVNTNTTYTVTTTDAAGCIYTKTTTVDISPAVEATGATGTKIYCASTPSTTLTATTNLGVAPYSAVWSGGPVVSTSGMSATLNPPVGTTTYSITVSDVCGTSSTTTVDVTVLPNPTAVVSPGTTNVCYGANQIQNITGSSPTSTYSWMPGSITGTSNTFTNVLASQTYTITITDGICSSTATFSHTVIAAPVFQTTSATPSSLVCAGDTVQLAAVAVSGVNSYVVSSIPYSPITPTGTPTKLCDSGLVKVTQTISGLDNGTWVNLPIGFNFDYYGNNINSFSVSTNGFITLGTSTLASAGGTVGQSLPSSTAPNFVVALAWGDLDFSTTGKIDYFVEGSSPNRQLIVRYVGAPRVGGTSGPTTGQIILNETLNTIELQVESVATASGDITTMGIENGPGNSAAVVTGRNASAPWTATNEGWLFEKSPVSSYTWANTDYMNNPNIRTPKVAPNYTTTYTVTASNSFGCTKTSTVTANVRDLVIGNVTPQLDTICFGESTTILGNVNVVCPGNAPLFQGYYAPSNWTQSNVNSNGFVSFAGVPFNIVLTSGSNGSGNDGYTNFSKVIGCAGNVTFNWAYSTADYAFTDVPYYSINGGTPVLFTTFNAAAVTSPNNQTGTMSIPVNAGDLLTISTYTIDNDAIPCSLTISNFIGPAAPITGTVSFWNSLTGGSNIGNASITVNPSTTTTYYAQFTDGIFGCVNPFRDSVKVTVNQLPIVSTSASPNDTVCVGDNVTLLGSGAISYTWEGVSTLTSDTTLTPAMNGAYTVVGTDANGCSNTATQTIFTNPLPVVTASVTSPVCRGKSTIFVGGGAGIGATYIWDNGVIDNTPYVQGVTGSIDYTVIGTDANSCSATSSVSLLVNSLPNITASASQSPICFGYSTILYGSGSGLGTSSYTWSDGTNTPIDSVAYTPSLAGNTIYTVTGTDANTCTKTSTVSVMVTSPATFNPAITLAAKCPGVTGASVLISSPSSSTFTIAPSATQPSSGIFTNMIGGTTYTVSFTDANNCTANSTVSATLPSNGGLSNATASNIQSVPGNSCQNQIQSDGLTLNYYGASCDNLIATVNDGAGGNILGNVNACVTVLPTVPTYNGQPYLPRIYDITPTNQGPATVTLYFTQDDFDDYNVAAGSFPQIPADQMVGTATFCISQVPQGFLPGASGASTIVHTITATWNALNNRWEVILPVNSFSGFYCHACNPLNAALPASIIDFKGKKTESTDLLTWTTTSEMNNDYFNILYSNNGKDYSKIGTIYSKANNGNSNIDLKYSFENTKPTLGHNYYKLEQVDIDGKSILNTNIVDLMWGSNGNTVSIYPNPAKDELNIDVYTTKAQNNTIKVLDMSGRVVKEVQSTLQTGTNNIKMNISELALGIYTIQILENNQILQVSKIEKN